MKKFIVLVTLALSFGFAASAQESQKPLSSFARIDIFGPFKVELIKSDKAAIAIQENDPEHIVCEVKNGALRLKFKNRHYVDTWTTDDYPRSRYIHATVYYTELKEVHAQAGAEVFSKGIVAAEVLTLDCTMGAAMDMEILSNELYTKTSMGAIVALEGSTKSHEVKASMGGIINATRLESSKVLVHARMGAEVNVKASREIEVNAGFGAAVNYWGDPAVRHTHKNFGAEVSGN